MEIAGIGGSSRPCCNDQKPLVAGPRRVSTTLLMERERRISSGFSASAPQADCRGCASRRSVRDSKPSPTIFSVGRIHSCTCPTVRVAPAVSALMLGSLRVPLRALLPPSLPRDGEPASLLRACNAINNACQTSFGVNCMCR
jgi:hypothetical protein